MTTANILIVEDEGILARGLENRLRRLGYIVAGTAATGEEAIRQAGHKKPDLAIMDIKLKGEMDGIEAARIIRDRFDIPVVYLTAYGDKETLKRAKITEPYGYIRKPVEERELHCNIEIALYRHMMEKDLLKKKKLEALSTFAGGIAHDFRNLLNLANGFIDSATEKSRHDPKMCRQPLMKARENLTRAANLVDKFFDIFKGELLNTKTIELSSVIEKATKSVSETRVPDVRYDLNVSRSRQPIRGDEERLIEVFSELLLNAIEAMADRKKGKVTITTEDIILNFEHNLPLREGTYIKVSIQDQGKGIPSENIEKVFEPYFSTKDAPTQKGLGLGLTMCYSIIKKHGGHIGIQSEEDKGTIVNVYLPA
jgi:signal transduction histidine kinase